MKTAGRQCRPIARGGSEVSAGILVESAWQVSGGTGVAAVHAKLEKLDPKDADAYADQTICATVQYGKGLVMVASFGNMFNDKNLGNDWSHDPDPAERARYDVLFALLRRLVKDEPIVVPTRIAPARRSRRSRSPLNRPGRRNPAAALPASGRDAAREAGQVLPC